MSEPEGVEPIEWDEVVDLLPIRIAHADALFPDRPHNFRGDSMAEYSATIPPGWWWNAYDELRLLGHLDEQPSARLDGGDACGRLSAEGRF